MSAFYPISFSALRRRATEHEVGVEEARVRFAQYAVLRAITSSRTLSEVLVFKGGNALDFVWRPNRSTRDLDFSADTSQFDPPSGSDRLGGLLTPAFGLVERSLTVTLRMQSIRQNPPGADSTFITYEVKVGYALPDQPRIREQIRSGKAVPGVVPLDISLNEPICADEKIDIQAANRSRVSTLEDIVAEKLRALLQQPIRNRARRQDLLDIASLLRGGAELDRELVSRFLQAKSKARGVAVSKAAFKNPEVAERARQDYDELLRDTRAVFVQYDEALRLLYSLTDTLFIPD